MNQPSVCLVTPALADANNGNWQTAQRWASLLAGDYRVSLAAQWTPATPPHDVLIALHARRSAASIAAWHEHASGKPLVVALTGTDLYRDIAEDASAQRSLELADALVVLQEAAPRTVPLHVRHKCVVSFQSTTSRATLPKPGRQLLALAVGHLRDVKGPEIYFEAARALGRRNDILLDHIGSALEPALGAQAQALMASQPHYHWLGGLPHATTRRHIQRAHVLVHMSHMEGGAHVVMEAICSGTPVLASRVDGNVGMLGAAYEGYFEPGSATGLVALLEQCRDDAAMLPRLRRQCALRAPLFSPERERATLKNLLANLLKARP